MWTKKLQLYQLPTDGGSGCLVDALLDLEASIFLALTLLEPI